MARQNTPPLHSTVSPEHTVLYAEEYSQFSQLLESFLAEHKPSTPTEQFFVEQLAISNWQHRLLLRTEVGLIDHQTTEAVRHLPDDQPESEPSAEDLDQENTLLLGISFHRDCLDGSARAKLMRGESMTERHFIRCLDRLERYQHRRRAKPPAKP